MLFTSAVLLILSTALHRASILSLLYGRVANLVVVYTLALLLTNSTTGEETLFSGLLCVSTYMDYISLLALAVAWAALNLYSHKSTQIHRSLEYPVVLLMSVIGTLLVLTSADMIVLFLAIELQSFSLYILCAALRNREASVSASLTYYLLGSLASAVLLMGLAMFYSIAGTTNLDSLGLLLQGGTLDGAMCATCLVLVGLLCKMAAAPVHFWSLDVYDALPLSTVMFITLIPKVAFVPLIHRMVLLTGGGLWDGPIAYAAIASMAIGAVLGLAQYRLKRLYACSAIVQLGILLAALITVTPATPSTVGFFLTQYTVATIVLFTGTIAMTIVSGVVVNDISSLGRSLVKNPATAVAMASVVFSLAGVPPHTGFFAKLLVIEHTQLVTLATLTSCVIVFSVVSAWYYLNMVIELFSGATSHPMPGVALPGYIANVISVGGLLVLAAPFFPASPLTMASQLVA